MLRRTNAPVLEVRPESPFVVFYGEPSESQSAELKGKVTLSTPEPISVRSIRVALVSTRKVSWPLTHSVSQQHMSQTSSLQIDTVNVFPVEGSNKNKQHKISAGHHEWDFTFTLPSNLDESVEGLLSNWVVYDLKVLVDKGYMSKHITATSHIRIIRTLSRDLLNSMPTDQVNEDIWAHKLAYKITIPQKNFMIGSPISVDFTLIPLKKGIEIATIRMELIEAHQIFSQGSGRRIGQQHEIPVVSVRGEKPENSAHFVPEGTENADQLFDESHRFTMILNLPKSLKDCRQSVDLEHIRVHHRLKIYINIKNPEGHTSQLLVKNFVKLFISPNVPPNADQSVTIDEQALNAQAIQEELNHHAPPMYGLHRLDQLYNDIDPSGFMASGGNPSRINSGANTPLRSHSCRSSIEDLPMQQQLGDSASAAVLQHRLQTLDNDFSLQSYQGYDSSGSSTPYTPRELYLDYDMDALARTPSYDTAVRTPSTAAVTSYMDLPSYASATSRPSSPTRSGSSRATTPSPVRSQVTLNEETYRNTAMNRRAASFRIH